MNIAVDLNSKNQRFDVILISSFTCMEIKIMVSLLYMWTGDVRIHQQSRL